MGADAFFAAFETEVFGGGGFDGNLVDADAHALAQGLAHLRYVWAHFGSLSHNDAVDIHYTVAAVVQ